MRRDQKRPSRKGGEGREHQRENVSCANVLLRKSKMTNLREARISDRRLVIVSVLGVLLMLGIEASKKVQKDPKLEYKVASARRAQEAFDVIKRERSRMGIGINRKDDPNETGMIGAEYTDLTSSLGSLSAKRTSTNPNFAGVIVEMLFKAGVKVGDPVAVSFSGSFPALNVAVLSAVCVLELEPVIISSLGASMYGANHPQLTWLDMERVLREKGVFPYASEAASLGGVLETQGGIDGLGIHMGLDAIRRSGVTYIREEGLRTLKDDVERRLAIFDQALSGKDPAVFINVGGNLVSLGSCPESYALSTGFIGRVPISDHPERGVIFRMSERGVPVIHLLNIKSIAVRYGLPMDPVPLPAVPSGRVMKPQKYSLGIALSGLIFLCLLLFATMRQKPSVSGSIGGMSRMFSEVPGKQK